MDQTLKWVLHIELVGKPGTLGDKYDFHFMVEGTVIQINHINYLELQTSLWNHNLYVYLWGPLKAHSWQQDS